MREPEAIPTPSNVPRATAPILAEKLRERFYRAKTNGQAILNFRRGPYRKKRGMEDER